MINISFILNKNNLNLSLSFDKMNFATAQEIILKEIQEYEKQSIPYGTGDYYLRDKYRSAFNMVEYQDDMHLLYNKNDSPYTHHIAHYKLRQRYIELMGEENFYRLKFIKK
jgi:hypothetical protein